jgi:hypothetical protein
MSTMRNKTGDSRTITRISKKRVELTDESISKEIVKSQEPRDVRKMQGYIASNI